MRERWEGLGVISLSPMDGSAAFAAAPPVCTSVAAYSCYVMVFVAAQWQFT